jgi:hypothetical protein
MAIAGEPSENVRCFAEKATNSEIRLQHNHLLRLNAALGRDPREFDELAHSQRRLLVEAGLVHEQVGPWVGVMKP